ncbi:glycosyl transferase [Micractinium conductrix]|uniref:Hexosyltransferase n=1 Tax=Micractinium conductrix TaxID=554055 RepID=A0A2P6VBI2_9CHLO|nr:glycosyl transferase [Micractinium conductrix]|eukprot:PSC71445.1 glycosyl transferase [Micractinium conductrix]
MPAALDTARAPSASSSSLESLGLAAPGTPAATAEGGAVIELAAPLAAPRPRAYVTLLTRDRYLPGVQALARSLQAVGAAHPLLVMHTPDTLSAEAVAALHGEPGCEPLRIQRYRPPGKHAASTYKLPAYAECWSKLRMWQLEQYERLIYLDADMILLRSIDHLFDLPHGFWAGAVQAPDCTAGRQTLAERDACPLFCCDRPQYFNAGLFVMQPSAAELARFECMLAAGKAVVGGYAEQDLLNAAFAQPIPLCCRAPGACCRTPSTAKRA